ncbi:uncharacterized protein LOC133816690 [Humulus lupulus]|uniref:uncharacterized protein LOC133816690 n=1 Tax=Humulus lupulus TaxID=3486 RepID=UPI002B409819|nr:uncharacterized protein LOC133816690 [Humulus lupulus]
MALQQREIECQHQELNKRQADMDRRQRDATVTLEVAIQLARGQPAPNSQPDLTPNVPPQQGTKLSPPPQPASLQRPDQPPVAQRDIPFQNPEQQPPSRSGRENPQHQWHNTAGRPPRSPRCQTAEEPNPLNKGQRPSARKRQVESGSAIRGPPQHNNARGPTDQRRPPPDARDMLARGGDM